MDLRSAHKAPDKPQPRLRLSLSSSLDAGAEDPEYDPCRRTLRPRLAQQTSDPQRSRIRCLRSNPLTPGSEDWGEGDGDDDDDDEEEEEEGEEEEDVREEEEDIKLEEEKSTSHRKARAEENGDIMNGMYDPIGSTLATSTSCRSRSGFSSRRSSFAR